MSLKEKKVWKLTFNIYLYCDYNYVSRLHDKFRKYFDRAISMKKLQRVTSKFTDRLFS